MLDSFDWIFDTVALIFLAALLVGLVVGLVLLGALPGRIAHKRGHAQADAVTVLGWVGVLLVPLWPLALAWAFVRPVGPAATAPPEPAQ